VAEGARWFRCYVVSNVSRVPDDDVLLVNGLAVDEAIDLGFTGRFGVIHSVI